MNAPIVFVAGTDTGVGKTILTAALVRRLRQRGLLVAALKPFCSGGRDDALALHRIPGNTLSLKEINPWHFRRALAPGIAAKAQRHPPRWREAARHIRTVAERHQVTVVEGAGGLLSPLTADGDATDLIRALGTIALVVCPNRLGAINQALLAWQALPAGAARTARLVLMAQPRPDDAARSNLKYLQARLGARQVFELPRLPPDELRGRAPLSRKVRRALDRLVSSIPFAPVD